MCVYTYIYTYLHLYLYLHVFLYLYLYLYLRNMPVRATSGFVLQFVLSVQVKSLFSSLPNEGKYHYRQGVNMCAPA